jgi:hypothetical protein
MRESSVLSCKELEDKVKAVVESDMLRKSPETHRITPMASSGFQSAPRIPPPNLPTKSAMRPWRWFVPAPTGSLSFVEAMSQETPLMSILTGPGLTNHSGLDRRWGATPKSQPRMAKVSSATATTSVGLRTST